MYTWSHIGENIQKEESVMIITTQGMSHFYNGLGNQDLGFEGKRTLVILDGCSKSNYPEVGTRLFAQIFQRKEDWENPEKFEENVKETFDDIIKFSEINFQGEEEKFIRDNMAFTIIACFKTEESYIVKILGDGYIVTQNAYGLISYTNFTYGNCPPYYAYRYIKENDYPIKEFTTVVFDRKKFLKIAIATDGITPFARELLKDKDQALIDGMSVSVKTAISRNKFSDDATIALFD